MSKVRIIELSPSALRLALLIAEAIRLHDLDERARRAKKKRGRK